MKKTEENAQFLVALQGGVPLERRPFAALGAEHGMSEDEVLAKLCALFDEGVARRFGAVFDLRRLGYRSTLCAVGVAAGKVDGVAARIVPHPGVTHCYLRGDQEGIGPADLGNNGSHVPNLWFTLSRLEASYDRAVRDLATALAPHRLLLFPAVRRFKIDVVFDPAVRDRAETFPGSGTASRSASFGTEPEVLASRTRFGSAPLRSPSLSDTDKALVRALQGNLPLVAQPFDAAAREVGLAPDDVVALLRNWNEAGLLRRVGVVLRHYQAGFRANAMCVWRASDEAVAAAGRRLAESPHVSHCYQRVTVPEFDYNLYAMIHSGTWETTLATFRGLGEDAGLTAGRALCSLREYKKTSPKYFCEEEGDGQCC